jgi:hypothetical protein
MWFKHVIFTCLGRNSCSSCSQECEVQESMYKNLSMGVWHIDNELSNNIKSERS